MQKIAHYVWAETMWLKQTSPHIGATYYAPLLDLWESRLGKDRNCMVSGPLGCEIRLFSTKLLE